MFQPFGRTHLCEPLVIIMTSVILTISMISLLIVCGRVGGDQNYKSLTMRTDYYCYYYYYHYDYYYYYSCCCY